MPDRLAASTNSYHTYTLEEALAGIAAAGFRSVELTSVPGWTEHVRRDADAAELQQVKDMLAKYGLTAVSLSGPIAASPPPALGRRSAPGTTAR